MAGIAVLTACHTEKEFDATGVFEATEIIVSAEGNGKILFSNLLAIFPPNQIERDEENQLQKDRAQL